MMKTAGEILKEARLEKGITLEEVAKQTKIRLQYLYDLEANRYTRLPSVASAKGFVRNYALFLGLSPQLVLSVFKRDFNQQEQRSCFFLPLDSRRFWGPKLSLVAVVSIFFLLVFGYLGYQYFSFAQQPSLEVFSPPLEMKTNQKEVVVKGRTDPSNSVFINQQLVGVNSDGSFSYRFFLLRGENTVVTEAVDKWGRKARDERKVYLLEKE